MKKILLFLSLFIILGLSPNISNAITQSQINSEVQIVCPDNYGNWFSGSGTIIDPKGIILTNKHVVTDEKNGIIKVCFVGFVESINSEPNFGTESNPNIAEVKYFTTTEDMDVAILYLENKTNKIYPYVDIWGSDSSSLKFGDKLEVIGFPGIGGSTITYSSGDFSGFGSGGDGTQNYIKTTAPLEHGNSGGASYNSTAKFIGIPTMVVAGTLNSLSYILSVNSIKNWLSGILGSGYQQEVIEQELTPTKPTVSVQKDITPPNFNILSELCYRIYNENHSSLGGRCFPKKMGKIEEYNHIQFAISAADLEKIDLNGLKNIYYYFDKTPYTQINDKAVKYIPEYLNQAKSDISITKIIDIAEPGKYYFTFFGEDNAGNISSPYVYEYIYEPDAYKGLEEISFYKDSALNDYIKGYSIKFYEDVGPSLKNDEPILCETRLNNLTITWNYLQKYSSYVVKNYNAWNALYDHSENGEIVNQNKYTISNLNKGNYVKWSTNEVQWFDFINDWRSNKYYEFHIKPFTGDSKLESKHRLFKIVYNPSAKEDLYCYEKIQNDESSYDSTHINFSSLNIDPNFSKKQIGKILLQIESHGEAWYVNPKDVKKYYMANGNKAYDIMRYFGIGITNKDLDKIKSSKTLAKKSSGKIFLQVESHGEAYYIDFNGVAHYLKDGAAAYEVMRSLGLGITNNDLNKIAEGSL